MLRGRSAETAMLHHRVTAAREGRSAALVIRGEAGIGKSALLDYAAANAGDLRMLRGAGIESESELPYAGLSMLLGRLVDRLEALPDRQSAALRGALGLGPPAETDPFLIGLAVLSLLAEAGPVLCLVDDAHWLDRASADALTFAARRLDAEGVVLLFAARQPYAPDFPTPGLPELRLGGLDEESAAALLSDLAPQERAEVLVEARGNPLALRELAAARGAGVPSTGNAPLQSQIQRTFADRIATLPARTRTLLEVAAADDTGEATTVLQAAKELDVDLADVEPAERARLMWLEGGQVVFGHPLMRTATLQRTSSAARVAAHRALARVLGGDRRAWHLAAAATGPDEDAATALADAAERARERGGYVAMTAAYERAAALSSDPDARDRRRFMAAWAASTAGQFARAETLADQVERGPGADLAKLRAVIADGLGRTEQAHAILFEAAVDIEPQEVEPILRSGVRAAWRANDFAAIERIADCAEPGSAVHRLATAALATNQLGEGGVRTLQALLAEASGEPADLQDRLLYARLHLIIGDYPGLAELAGRLERECRARGAFGVLPEVLVLLAHGQIFGGQYADARATLTDGIRIATDTCQRTPRLELSTMLAELAAIEGDEERCRELVAEAVERGLAPASAHAATALSLLDLGLGRYEPALERLAAVVEGERPMGVVAGLPIVVEAAVRLGRPERGDRALRLFTEWAATVGQPWADAAALRCQAMRGGDLDRFAQALRLAENPFHRARTELMYGERLRRDRRLTEARAQLRAAAETFERLGARPWAERARLELRATGETRAARARAPDLADRLTPQERQVVRLAAQGMSNREIAAQLFVSPRTVGYHLHKVFPKLGVSSRAELAALGL